MAQVCHGLTEVSVRVFGPREAKLRRETIHDRANTNVQIIMVPFSGGGGGRRRGRGDKCVRFIFYPFLSCGDEQGSILTWATDIQAITRIERGHQIHF